MRPTLNWISSGRLLKGSPFARSFAVCQLQDASRDSRSLRTVSVEAQSQILPGDERIHVSTLLEDPHQLMSVPKSFGDVNTVYDMLRHSLTEYPKKQCLGTRDPRSGKYEWVDYQQVYERARYTGSSFQEFGLEPKNSTFIGINCKNIPEFCYTFMGCSMYSNVFIPLYDTLDRDAVKYIISITDLPLYICDSEDKARFVIKNKESFPQLRTVITIARPSRDLIADAKAVGLELLGFLDFELKGKMKLKIPVPPKPDDLFTICWTSGTTGRPKGALVTHSNVACVVESFASVTHPAPLGKGYVISYMPTGHIYELIIQVQSLAYGIGIGFFGGDVLKLMEDINALKPTVVPMVPRLLNRLYAKAQQDIKSSTVKRLLLPVALKRKEAQLKRGVVSHETIWDKVVFKSVRQMFGSNIELMTNSAAPLSPKVAKFFRCALGCYIFDAYGQTELGPLSLTLPNEWDGGHVGAPVPTAQVKLIDVPEMNYYAKDNVGEICARGPSVCLGYYKNPEATKEAITEDKWLLTGDIGQWLPNGTLKIIDRKKNFFKLSQGEFVAPDKLESSYAQSPNVAQIFVDGLPDKNFLVAIVVPDPLAFPLWLKKKGVKEGKLAEHCHNVEVRKLLLEHLRKLGSKNDMKSFELIRNIHLHPYLMTVESGLMTPTMKIKRKQASKTFREAIDKMYEEGPMM